MKIVFEGDCKQVMELTNESILNFSVFNRIRELQFWSQHFEEIQIKWTPKINNHPGDELCSF